MLEVLLFIEPLNLTRKERLKRLLLEKKKIIKKQLNLKLQKL